MHVVQDMLVIRGELQLVALVLHIEVVDYLQAVLEGEVAEVLGLDVQHVQEVVDD